MTRKKAPPPEPTPEPLEEAPFVREWEQDFLAGLREHGTVRSACEAAGISRTIAYRHRDESPLFAAAWREALDDGVDQLELAARKRALCESDTLLIFLLKAHRPEVYRDRLELTPNPPLDISRLSEAERRLLLDALRRAQTPALPAPVAPGSS